jgi:EpsI family protein
MQINQRSYITVVVLLALTFSFLVYVHVGRAKVYSSQGVIELSDFPLEIGEWQGKEIPLSERTYELLGTRNVIFREYTNSTGDSIGLSIVRGSGDRSSFHPPEICYVGGGVELIDKSLEDIELNSTSIKTNRLVLKDNAGFQVAWYWFTVGDKVTHNYYLQQVYMIFNELLRKDNSGASLIRISKSVNRQDLTQADDTVKDFISKLSIFLNAKS